MRSISQAHGALNELAKLFPDSAVRVVWERTETVPLSDLRDGVTPPEGHYGFEMGMFVRIAETCATGGTSKRLIRPVAGGVVDYGLVGRRRRYDIGVSGRTKARGM